MRTPTEVEELLLRTQRELQAEPRIDVRFSETGSLTETVSTEPAIFGYMPEWPGAIISDTLCLGSPRIREVSSFWHMNTGATLLHGEFWLHDIFISLLKPAPDAAWSGSPQEEKDFFASLRVVDDTPVASTGQWAAVQVIPDTDPLPLWYYDMGLSRAADQGKQYFRMTIDFPEYLRQLAVTKGVFGWQYLFTDETDLRGPEFHETAARLRTMVEQFPDMFPDWDYTPLAQRLEERV